MAGSPLKRQRREASAPAPSGVEQARLMELKARQDAEALPTEPRDQPATYSEALIPELMQLAALGLSYAEVASHWLIDEQTLTDWGKAHTEFDAALRRARARAKAWWEKAARIALATRDNKFPAGAWSHLMRAKYPEYDDKRGVSITVNTDGLVILDLSHSPRERMGQAPNHRESLEAVQHEGSYTVITDGKSSLSEDAETLAPVGDEAGPGEAGGRG